MDMMTQSGGRRTRLLGFAVVVSVLAHSAPALGCIWDSDTLEMERQRFPTVYELMTGKFARHSEFFHHWRVADRARKLRALQHQLQNDPAPQLVLLDDLAVSLEKLGRREEALDVILQSDELKPNRYETHANWATILIHMGRLEEALPHLDRALEINPDAHFGREIYQKLLVEYVIGRRAKHGSSLPLFGPDERESVYSSLTKNGPGGVIYPGFFTYVLEKRGLSPPDPALSREIQHERARAIRGLAGMMRFGDYSSPVLLEAIADVLGSTHELYLDDDASLMAARAYLLAGRNSGQLKSYEVLAQKTLENHESISLGKLGRSLTADLAAGGNWFAGIARDERRWISQGADPEVRFREKYYQTPRNDGPP